MLIPMILTMWKIPSMIKILRINGHLKNDEKIDLNKLSELDKIKLLKAKNKIFMNIHQCIIYNFFSWLFDIPLVPLAVVVAICFPWRFLTIFRTLIRPDDRLPTKFAIYKLVFSKRMHMFANLIFIILADAVLIIATVLLLVTVWRAGVTIQLYMEYLRYLFTEKKEKPEQELSKFDKGLFSIHKHILHHCGYLLLDILQLIQVIIILLFIMEAPALIRRLKNMFKRHRQEQRITILNKQKAIIKPGQKTFSGLSLNVLGNVLTFCDVPDIIRFEQTCKRGYEATLIPRVWRNLYEKRYTTFAPLPPGQDEPDYKHYCIQGLKNKIEKERAKDMPIISEEERDMKIGVRLVICEEFLFAFLRLPHTLIIPIKALAWLAYFTRGFIMKFTDTLIVNGEFAPVTARFLAFTAPEFHVYKEIDDNEIHDFWRVQDNLFVTALIFYDCISQVISYIIGKLNFTLMKISTGYTVHPINIANGFNELPNNAWNNRQPLQNQKFNYFLQIIFFPIMIFDCLGWFAIPVILGWRAGFDIAHVLTGKYFTNVFIYALGVPVCITTLDLCRFAYNYNPFIGIAIAGAYVGNTTKDYISLVAGAIFGIIKGLFNRFLRPIIRAVLDGILNSARLVTISVTKIIKLIFTIYFFPLVASATLGKPLGIVGEFITLVLGIPWLFWPMAVPWYMHNKVLYIPAVILTSVLIVMGRSALKSI